MTRSSLFYYSMFAKIRQKQVYEKTFLYNSIYRSIHSISNKKRMDLSNKDMILLINKEGVIVYHQKGVGKINIEIIKNEILKLHN